MTLKHRLMTLSVVAALMALGGLLLLGGGVTLAPSAKAQTAPGLVFDMDSYTVTEGQSGTTDIRIKLATQPATGLYVRVSWGQRTHLRQFCDTSGVEPLPPFDRVDFDSTNWDTYQTLSMEDKPFESGFQNGPVDSWTCTLPINVGAWDSVTNAGVTSSPYYQMSADQRSFTVNYVNTTPGILVGDVEVYEGGTAPLNVTLAAEPSANVTVEATSSNVNTTTVSPASRTFTPTNWDRPQSFTVSGLVDGGDNEERSGGTITVSVSSGTTGYAAADATADVTIIDLSTRVRRLHGELNEFLSASLYVSLPPTKTLNDLLDDPDFADWHEELGKKRDALGADVAARFAIFRQHLDLPTACVYRADRDSDPSSWPRLSGEPSGCPSNYDAAERHANYAPFAIEVKLFEYLDTAEGTLDEALDRAGIRLETAQAMVVESCASDKSDLHAAQEAIENWHTNNAETEYSRKTAEAWATYETQLENAEDTHNTSMENAQAAYDRADEAAWAAWQRGVLAGGNIAALTQTRDTALASAATTHANAVESANNTLEAAIERLGDGFEGAVARITISPPASLAAAERTAQRELDSCRSTAASRQRTIDNAQDVHDRAAATAWRTYLNGLADQANVTLETGQAADVSLSRLPRASYYILEDSNGNAVTSVSGLTFEGYVDADQDGGDPVTDTSGWPRLTGTPTTTFTGTFTLKAVGGDGTVGTGVTFTITIRNP